MTLNSHFALNVVFLVESFSMDALVVRHGCFKIVGDGHYTVSGKHVAHGLWFLAIGLCRYSSGFAAEVLSNESAVVETASLLCRSLYRPYEVPHWLYISKFTRLRAVSRRQHGSYC